MDDLKKKFKAAQFLQDLGLMKSDPIIIEKVEEKSNLVKFLDKKKPYPDMDVPEYAVWVALKNLVATYGMDKVDEGIADLKKIS